MCCRPVHHRPPCLLQPGLRRRCPAGPSRRGGERLGAAVDDGGEQAAVAVEPVSHVAPLRALPREDEGGPAARCRTSGDHAGRLGAFGGGPGECRECAAQLLGAVGDECRPVGEVVATPRQGAGHIGGIGFLGGELVVQLRGPPGEQRRPPGGEGDDRGQTGGRGRRGARSVRRLRRRARDDDVGVRAAPSEGVDAEVDGPVGGQPQGFPYDLEIQLVEGDVGVQLFGVQGRGHDPVAQREQYLDQPRQSGTALQVTDVGLHRADRQRISGWSCQAEDGAERAASVGSPRLVPVPWASTYERAAAGTVRCP